MLQSFGYRGIVLYDGQCIVSDLCLLSVRKMDEFLKFTKKVSTRKNNKERCGYDRGVNIVPTEKVV